MNRKCNNTPDLVPYDFHVETRMCGHPFRHWAMIVFFFLLLVFLSNVIVAFLGAFLASRALRRSLAKSDNCWLISLALSGDLERLDSTLSRAQSDDGVVLIAVPDTGLGVGVGQALREACRMAGVRCSMLTTPNGECLRLGIAPAGSATKVVKSWSQERFSAKTDSMIRSGWVPVSREFRPRFSLTNGFYAQSFLRTMPAPCSA